ncbi:hypothetical protein CDAR_405431 [Caerostris darwini]|uniref:Uncharacterized protein n=1 Tax=Caerostris darwini TaxID=1538125 RepID=A0AAV4WHP3_9ARAC|nr:hypothetical protein CDAR_405431 [Caerostris darwini]
MARTYIYYCADKLLSSFHIGCHPTVAAQEMMTQSPEHISPYINIAVFWKIFPFPIEKKNSKKRESPKIIESYFFLPGGHKSIVSVRFPQPTRESLPNRQRLQRPPALVHSFPDYYHISRISSVFLCLYLFSICQFGSSEGRM